MFPRLMSRGSFVLGLAALLGACGQPADLQVTEPKIRQLLPNRDTTAAYFNLRNNTQNTLTLTGARSPNARAIEMHRSVVKADRVSMQRVPQVTVGPGEQLAFEPGGLHLMVFGVSNLSQPFPITLVFADGHQLDVAFNTLAN